MKHLILLAALVAAPTLSAPVQTSAASEPSWKKAAAEVAARASEPGADRRAKNIILFVGDGMGVSTITAARIFEAQQRAKAAGGTLPGFEGGEENLLSFELLPRTAMVKTYNTDAQVPDSAGTASAMLMGAKTRIGVINLLPGQNGETCRTPDRYPKTLGQLARERGMGVGVVTTTRITHATPAALYAHEPQRDWEATDRNWPVAFRKTGCIDIAAQMLAFPGGMDVMLGGGRSRFLPVNAGGLRDDGRDLLSEWRRANRGAAYVADAAAFRALTADGQEPVLGLFNDDHLDFNFDADRTKEPSLAEMTEFAIARLEARAKRTGQGYVLLVEGGRIDHAHHLTNAYRALDETVEFAKAVAVARDKVSTDDTLILVTADHGHVFTIAGYPPRGNAILGRLRPIPGGEGRVSVDADGAVLDQLGRPVTTLGYANGPLSVRMGDKTLSSAGSPGDPDYLHPKTFLFGAETHSGEDVILYADGPGSALVSGTIEQNSIFHIITHALGWR